MGSVSTYFAIMKAYTTMNIFLLPIGFRNGGWLLSPLALILACFFETYSAVKLCDVANQVKIYNYPDIVDYAFGPVAKIFYQIA